MKLRFGAFAASLRCFVPLVLVDETIKCRCPSVGITAGGETSAISIWLHHLCCRNKNMGPDFTGWNKNSSKWVKYEKVTVFSSPLLSLSAPPPPGPQWGLMGAEEDLLVWARRREGQGQTRWDTSGFEDQTGCSEVQMSQSGGFNKQSRAAETGRRSRGQ